MKKSLVKKKSIKKDDEKDVFKTVVFKRIKSRNGRITFIKVKEVTSKTY